MGSVAQVVTGQGAFGEYLSINLGFGLGVAMGVHIGGRISGRNFHILRFGPRLHRNNVGTLLKLIKVKLL